MNNLELHNLYLRKMLRVLLDISYFKFHKNVIAFILKLLSITACP